MYRSPRELLRDGAGRAEAEAGHGAEEPFEPLRLGVQSLEEVAAALDLVLRATRLQRLGQRTPEGVEARVRHLQHAAEVGGLGPVEERVRLGRVGVAAFRVAVEHAERDERVEEVARGARVKAEAVAERRGVERPAGQFGEEAEFDRAQQGLRTPEAEAELHDPFGGD